MVSFRWGFFHSQSEEKKILHLKLTQKAHRPKMKTNDFFFYDKNNNSLLNECEMYFHFSFFFFFTCVSGANMFRELKQDYFWWTFIFA